MLRFRIARRRAAGLMLAGTGTLTLDQRIAKPMVPLGGDGLAQDWRAVGGDLRRAMGQVGRGKRPA